MEGTFLLYNDFNLPLSNHLLNVNVPSVHVYSWVYIYVCPVVVVIIVGSLVPFFIPSFFLCLVILSTPATFSILTVLCLQCDLFFLLVRSHTLFCFHSELERRQCLFLLQCDILLHTNLPDAKRKRATHTAEDLILIFSFCHSFYLAVSLSLLLSFVNVIAYWRTVLSVSICHIFIAIHFVFGFHFFSI